MSNMLEKVARAIAAGNGDDYDTSPKHKADWNKRRGMYQDRFRDINEPFQSEYDDMAKAALEAMMEPSDQMIAIGANEYDAGWCYSNPPIVEVQWAKDSWQAMIQAAIDE